MIKGKKGQAVLWGLFRTFILVVLGLFLMNIYPTFRDLAFNATTSLWIRIPVAAIPVFYFVGIVFSFVRTIRSGATG